jgi:hypothetical protein
MPSPDEILFGLTSIANEWRDVAIAWHVGLAVALLALLAGWRPSIRIAGYLLASSFVSVATAAFASGNPFNGLVFAVLSLILISIARRLPQEPVFVAEPRVVMAGALLVAFGAVYPHFLETDNWATYAYAAPLGLIPCPTLSATMGASLAFGLFHSRRWAFTLAAAGGVYGGVGVFVLGVTLDCVLLAGTLLVVETVLPFARFLHWSTKDHREGSNVDAHPRPH